MTCGRGLDVSMITTLSARMRRRCTSSAGNACRLQNQRPADRSRASSGAAELLPGRRYGPRVADQRGALGAPDVDAELERVGADDRGDIAVAQTRLDLSAVQRQVSGAIASHAFGGVESRRE